MAGFAEEFLSELLRVRGLGRPNGQMLFAYRLTTEEYRQAKTCLARLLVPDSTGRIRLRSQHECGVFALYAAEWWKREYSGGPWRWSDMLADVLPPQARLHVDERSAAIELGSRYWGHRPAAVGRQYFGFVVAHGGLPVRLLEKGHAPIADLLYRGLRQASRFAWGDDVLTDFFGRNDDRLAASLQQPEIHRLLSEMVRTVLELREIHGLAGRDRPAEFLDGCEPGWRNRFPVPLEEGAAGNLLLGLVHEAAAAHSSQGQSPILVERFLVAETQQRFALRSRVQIPRSLDAETLATLFGIPADHLPRYFTIDLEAGGVRSTLCNGRLLLNSSTPVAALVQVDGLLEGERALDEHVLHLRDARGDVGVPSSVCGSGRLEPDTPWVFIDRSGQPELVAIGACRLPEPQALVACPADATVSQGGLPLEPVAVLTGVTGRQLFSVAGACLVTVDVHPFAIATGQPVESPDQYVWKGARLGFATRPMAVFLGPPVLYRHPSDGAPRRVAGADLEWLALQDGRDRPVIDPRSYRGPVEVWVREGGQRLARFRFVLESPQAAIALTCGSSPDEGSVSLRGWSVTDLSGPAGLTAGSSRSAGQYGLMLRSESGPPATVEIEALWAAYSRSLRLTVPFPSAGGQFLDPQGNRLPSGTRLASGRLEGCRARIMNRNPQSPRAYVLELTLNHSRLSGARRLRREIPFFPDPHGAAEIRLIDLAGPLAALFVLSDELDATVEMAICSQGQAVSRLLVGRYDAELIREGLSFISRAAEIPAALSGGLAGTSLLAVPLVSREAPAVALPKQLTEDGAAWDVSGLDSAHGPWLIVPQQGAVVRFRPALYRPIPVTGGSTHPAGLCPLGDAMCENDAGIRATGIADAVAAMAQDFSHPSWALAEFHLRELGHLPLSTLDSWRAIAQDPDACLAAVLLLGEDARSLIRRFQDELGVVWELLSVRRLSVMADRLRQDKRRRFGEALQNDRLIDQLVDDRVRQFSLEIPSLDLLVEQARFDAGLDNAPGGLEVFRREWAQSQARVLGALWRDPQSALGQQLLLRAHADTPGWPAFGLTERAVTVLNDVLTSQAGETLSHHGGALFRTDNLPAFCRDVANVPSLCAVWAFTDAPRDLWHRPEVQFQLRSLRAFDPVWFQEAFAQACRICKGLKLNFRSIHPFSVGAPVSPARHS